MTASKRAKVEALRDAATTPGEREAAEAALQRLDAPDTALAPLAGAERALAEASSILEVRDVLAVAEGAKRWAKARGLGIEAENKAAAIILRAERKIGALLIAGREAGVLAEQGGHRHGKVSPGVHRVDPSEVKTLADIGLTNSKDASNYQALARVPDKDFEAMLERTLATGHRIAKVDFYRFTRAKTAREKDAAREVKQSPSAFLSFRAGAMALLGWTVDESGEGRATENGLLALPDDELRQVADLVRGLAQAYNVVRASRS